MERKWELMSKKLSEGIINAVAELNFEQMTPVQVKSCYIAHSPVCLETAMLDSSRQAVSG